MPEIEPYKKHFDADDYFEIYKQYFASIDGNPKTVNPANILSTRSDAAEHLYPSFPEPEEIVPYYNDSTKRRVQKYKRPITSLFSDWDKTSYSPEEITLCHSITIGSYAVLDVIKNQIKTLIFESPCYYATMIQAERLGLKYYRIPTYRQSDFRYTLTKDDIKKHGPVALWITQPRISLGINQNIQDLTETMAAMSENDLIIIDEATELFYPSHLHEIINNNTGPKVIRLKGIFKGLGMNGPRIAAIIHDNSLKERLQLALWVYQGGLDVFSLELAKKNASDINKFRTMIEVSKDQAIKMRERLEPLTYGANVELSPLENGYTGCLIIDMSKLDGSSYAERRASLLAHLRNNYIVATLGASMKFAHDEQREFLRLNYFTGFFDLSNAISRIAEMKQMRDEK